MNRSLSVVGHWTEVGANLGQTSWEVGLNFQQSWTRIAKEPNTLRTGAHVGLQVGKSQSILCERIMATFS